MNKLVLILLFCAFELSSQSWEVIGLTNREVTNMTFADSSLYISGDYTYINDIPYSTISKYNGLTFDSLNCGVGTICGSILSEGGWQGSKKSISFNNRLIVTGFFNNASSINSNSLSFFFENYWDSYGSGLKNANNTIGRGNFLSKDSNLVYLTGSFDSINGIPAQSAAIFDGVTWYEPANFSRIDPDWSNDFHIIYPYKDYLYFAGTFCDNLNIDRKVCRIARFRNGEWSGVGNGVFSGLGFVNSMTIYKEKLIFGGTMSKSQGDPGDGVAAWDGENWDTMGGGVYSSSVVQVSEMVANGDYLYVCGRFESAGGQPALSIARWDGINWCSLDSIENYLDVCVSMGFFKDTLIVSGAKYFNGYPEIRLVKWLTPGQVSNCGNATSIANVKKKNFSIYPNPTNNIFNIQFNESFSGSVFITDITGRLLKSELFDDKTLITLNLELYSNGIYFVSVINKTKEFETVKIVKF
jgi:hypothetical protein